MYVCKSSFMVRVTRYIQYNITYITYCKYQLADFLKSQYHGYSGKEWYKCYKNVTIAQDNKQRLNIMNIWKSWHYSSLKNIEYLENIEWKTETNLERMRRPIILSVVNVRILSLDILHQYSFTFTFTWSTSERSHVH